MYIAYISVDITFPTTSFYFLLHLTALQDVQKSCSQIRYHIVTKENCLSNSGVAGKYLMQEHEQIC